MNFNLADAILILIIALFFAWGFIIGFRKSLVRLIGFGVSLLISVLLAGLVARSLLNIDFIANFVAGSQNSLYSFFHYRLSSQLDQITIEYLRAAYSYGGAYAVDAVFQDTRAVFRLVVYPLVRSAATSSVMLNSNMETARDLFALELAYGTAVLITGALLFFLLRIFIACLNIVLKKRSKSKQAANKMQNTLGRLLGAPLGAMRGLFFVSTILVVLSLMSGFSFMERPMEEIQSSIVASTISRGTQAISQLIIHSNPDNARFEILLEAAGFEKIVVYNTSAY